MIRNLLVSGILAAGLVTSAVAQDAVFWKSVGDWEVSIDPTIRNGCYAVATWNGGTVLRIGLNPEEDNFYFLVGNSKWSSLRPSTNYEVQIRFDSRAPWDVSAVGLQFNPGEVVYLHAESTKFEFLEEFMSGYRMKISYDGNEIDTLKLSGSRRAFNEVMACQEVVDKRGTNVEDPFAGAAPSTGTGKRARAVDDPFAD